MVCFITTETKDLSVIPKMAREAYILSVLGRQGGGKTYQQIIEALHYAKARKVLVFDCNVPSGSYEKFPTIDYDSSLADEYKHGKVMKDNSVVRANTIKQWQGPAGCRRVINYRKDGQQMGIVEMNQVALDLIQHFKYGMLILEDTNAYLIGARALAFLSNFIRCRHNGVDLVLIFQSAGAMDPRIWANTSLLRMHKTLDSVRTPSIRKRIPNGSFEMVMLGELMVNEQYEVGNIYFFVYLELRKYKFISIPASLLERACHKYLNIFSGELKSFMAENEIKDVGKAKKLWADKAIKKYL